MPDRTETAGPAPGTTPPRGRRSARLALGGAAVLVCGLAVLYGMGPRGKETAGACPAAKDVTAKLDPLIHGEVAAFGLSQPARLAPDLAFKGAEGQPVTLASFKGKTVLVNFWATWCVPCRKEMPALDALQGARGDKDFEVLAVNVDTARLDGPKTFLKEAGVKNLGFYSDPSGDVLQILKERGELLGLPTTLLIDRNGCELGRIAGPAEWASPDAQALIAAATSS